MKITPITFQQNRYNNNSTQKKQNNNPSFGYVDPRRKYAIERYLIPEDITGEEREKMYKVFEEDEGIMVKFTIPRLVNNKPMPYIWAEIIKDHVDKSCAKKIYKKAPRQGLQRPEIAMQLYHALLKVKEEEASMERFLAREEELKKERENGLDDCFPTWEEEQAERDNNIIYGMFNRI